MHDPGHDNTHLPPPTEGSGLRGARSTAAFDGRFAPSPTGVLHLGNLRTALAAWLCARSAGARFLVRIEDLDPDRSRRALAAAQLRDLAALGLDWDEEPVWQSERLDLYQQAIDTLREQDAVYPCFCTRAEVRAAASAPHQEPGVDAAGRPVDAYPGTCARIAPRQAARRIMGGEAHCMRVRAGARTISFDDRLQGTVSICVDDFAISRKDGVPAYNLAVMVDDSAQRIGEVVRGADLVESTPRQLLVADLLGVPVPAYAHVGLMVGPDGARLAKRHGSVTLAQAATHGQSPPDVLAFLARSLGIDVAQDERPAVADLLDRFDRSRLPGGSATFRSIAHALHP